jgi:hypothetical protein
MACRQHVVQPGRPEVKQLFISVDDVQGAGKAAGLGAKFQIPPTTLPGGETMAVLHDRPGMPSAVWRVKS